MKENSCLQESRSIAEERELEYRISEWMKLAKALGKQTRQPNPAGLGKVSKTSRMRGYLNCILEEEE